jgi:probable FeS assembly SUF system protein SufT
MSQARTLSRDVTATLVPYGQTITLETGTTVIITQSLGGSFTGTTDLGYMVRIEGRDADAIGEKPPAAPSTAADDLPLRDRVWAELRTCYDPEIPVNIVELGLVYGCEVVELPEGGSRVTVSFTLTAPGCGMSEFLREDMRRKIATIPGVKEADVQLVFEPPWNPTMMSDAARLQLGFM